MAPWLHRCRNRVTNCRCFIHWKTELEILHFWNVILELDDIFPEIWKVEAKILTKNVFQSSWWLPVFFRLSRLELQVTGSTSWMKWLRRPAVQRGALQFSRKHCNDSNDSVFEFLSFRSMSVHKNLKPWRFTRNTMTVSNSFANSIKSLLQILFEIADFDLIVRIVHFVLLVRKMLPRFCSHLELTMRSDAGMGNTDVDEAACRLETCFLKITNRQPGTWSRIEGWARQVDFGGPKDQRNN